MQTEPPEKRREYHVTLRYLAESRGTGDAGFAAVADWPHHYFGEGTAHIL
ncbi:hypothetical protein [Streptomyces sp. Da 82-17]